MVGRVSKGNLARVSNQNLVWVESGSSNFILSKITIYPIGNQDLTNTPIYAMDFCHGVRTNQFVYFIYICVSYRIEK
jgi:hypothetical protein